MRELGGKFIVLDGGEGCGKSTQCRLLAESLTARGVSVLPVRDPGTTRLGEQIRAILLDPASSPMSMRCEMLLYMAARAQMMREVIAPALDGGQCVVSDRFISSTLAYQLDGEGLTFDEIVAVGKVATGNRWPDLTIILDMPVEQSSRRIDRPRDRIEQRSVDYHQRVRANYLQLAKLQPERTRVVAADRSIQAVHAEILRVLETWGMST